jgi:hypothetical protein
MSLDALRRFKTALRYFQIIPDDPLPHYTQTMVSGRTLGSTRLFCDFRKLSVYSLCGVCVVIEGLPGFAGNSTTFLPRPFQDSAEGNQKSSHN